MPAVKKANHRAIEIFKDKSGRHRFRVRARNGRILASSQAYAHRAGAYKGAAALRRVMQEAVEAGDLPEGEGEGCSRTNS